MKKIKVLQLERWMKQKILRENGMGLIEIAPILWRDGYYKSGYFVWFEYNGKAWEYPHNDFDYDLHILSHRPLRESEINGLKAISNIKGHKISSLARKILSDQQMFLILYGTHKNFNKKIKYKDFIHANLS